jgi:hypothetical protein
MRLLMPFEERGHLLDHDIEAIEGILVALCGR